ncbi:MAG: CRISPR-associated endonuclease Cas2 [bacterium]|nr:CRISPR-associated endonuclease Cas2 [bacterium]
MPIKARHQETIRNLTEAVVEVVGLLSGITYLALARGVPGRIPKDASLLHTFARRHIPRAIRRAERRGLITVNERAHRPPIVRITEKGRHLLARRQLEHAAVERPKRWDGKWRLVTFDVPEKRRRDRHLLRSTLQQLGFYRLQQSVWLYPYDCHDLVTLARTTCELQHITVRYAIVEYLEEDTGIRSHFDI